MEMNVQFYATAVLPLAKLLRYQLDKGPSGLQSQSGRAGEENKSAHAGNRTSIA
jgi:hypothetical protein